MNGDRTAAIAIAVVVIGVLLFIYVGPLIGQLPPDGSPMVYVDMNLKEENSESFTFEITSYHATDLAPTCQLKDVRINLTVDSWQLGGGTANETPFHLPAGDRTYTLFYVDNDANGNITAGDYIVVNSSRGLVSYSRYTMTLTFLKMDTYMGCVVYPLPPQRACASS